jgi:aryl-alcohol dehydrogenase-like predicted oxidoreductase
MRRYGMVIGIRREKLDEYKALHTDAWPGVGDAAISTKVGWLLDTDGAARPDFSAGGVMASLESSLSRLGVDAVDLVHIHDPDEHPSR